MAESSGHCRSGRGRLRASEAHGFLKAAGSSILSNYVPSRPRLRKILRDLRSYKTRTTVAVVTITISTIAVGTIVRAWAYLSHDLALEYSQVHPASIVLSTDGLFGNDLISAVGEMPDVAAADARYRSDVQVQIDPNKWQWMQLYALGDYHDLSVDIVQHDKGIWPPPEGMILLERSSLRTSLDGSGQSNGVNRSIPIEMPDGRRRALTLAGTAHDLLQYPTPLSGITYGYISQDTLEGLTGTRGYNRLSVISVADGEESASLQELSERISHLITAHGFEVTSKYFPPQDPYPFSQIIRSALFILSAFSLFSLFLSAMLVVSTMSVVMAREVRQIGIMKTIGAHQHDLRRIYLGLVLAVGLISVFIAVPISTLAAHRFARFIAHELNFDGDRFVLPVWIYGLDMLVGCGIPLLVAWWPVSCGIRLTIREALQFADAVSIGAGVGHSNRLLVRLPGMPTPVLYSLRNMSRHRFQSALTLLALTLAGTAFIIVVAIRSALIMTVDGVAGYWRQDILLYLRGDAHWEEVERSAMRLPGVVYAEARRIAIPAVRLLDGDSESNSKITLFGVLPDSPFIAPVLLQGRWLLPEDQNAIVVNINLVDAESDLSVGDEVVFDIGGRETDWCIVGIVTSQVVGAGGLMEAIGYAPYDYLSQVVGVSDKTDRVLVETREHTIRYQAAMAHELESHFQRRGHDIKFVELNADIHARLINVFGILISVLLGITGLLTIAGGLGLMGTISQNVLERTREIAIIRTIGASNNVVAQLVIIEGVLIGVLSWLLSVLLAIPCNYWLTRQIGLILLEVPLHHQLPFGSAFLWLGIVIPLSAAASLLPAWRAVRLSVRQAISYE